MKSLAFRLLFDYDFSYVCSLHVIFYIEKQKKLIRNLELKHFLSIFEASVACYRYDKKENYSSK